MSLLSAFVLWAVKRAQRRAKVRSTMWCRRPVGPPGVPPSFWRFEPFKRDEFPDSYGEMHGALPRWLPINALLHCWLRSDPAQMHDHPRWSITLCLRGHILEHTPWGSRMLAPGSIVLRSHKAIHRFELPPSGAGKTWTLFVVGRRKHAQHYYAVTPM